MLCGAERCLTTTPLEQDGEMVVGGNALPLMLDQGGELRVRLEALTLQRSSPIRGEAPRARFPELGERFFEEVSGVRPRSLGKYSA
jgi:hypothetical protein